MAPRPRWWHQLQAGKQEALLAVDLYNRVGETRRLEAFIVHMQIAWLYVLQARFDRDGVDYWYRTSGGRRIRGKDGEFRTWTLRESLAEVVPDPNDPVRRNVEFFIGLRDKIEHRYARDLEPVVAGKCQSLIINFEDSLTDTFGGSEGLADQLRFPVFLSTLTDDAVSALKSTYKRLPKRVTNYVEEYDAALGDDVRSDHRYDFRVLLIPQTGSKTDADVAMRFVRVEQLPKDQQDQLQVVQTIVRDKQVPVSNLDRYKPSVVSKKVEAALGVRFSVSSAHTAAWRYYKVRPPQGADRPERTKAQYCVWDEPHGDYLYLQAWINRLIKELKDPAKFREVVGRDPTPLMDSDG